MTFSQTSEMSDLSSQSGEKRTLIRSLSPIAIGMLRAGICVNCAEKTAALILESGPGEIAVEPCSGACREAIELYFSTPPERWRAPLTR